MTGVPGPTSLHRSCLARAAEFGAFWHGLDWSVHTIISKPPRQADDPDVSVADREEGEDAPVGNWTWHSPVPEIWEPIFVETGNTKRSSCTLTILSLENTSTEPRTPITLAAILGRQKPRCCARAMGVSSSERSSSWSGCSCEYPQPVVGQRPQVFLGSDPDLPACMVCPAVGPARDLAARTPIVQDPESIEALLQLVSTSAGSVRSNVRGALPPRAGPTCWSYTSAWASTKL